MLSCSSCAFRVAFRVCAFFSELSPAPGACDGVTQYISSSGYGSEDDVVWTITNVVTGEEVATGDINECCGSDQYDWACFEDGVYELTTCDSGDANFYNDWYVEINTDNSWTSIYASDLENAGIYGDGTDYGCYSEYFTVNSTIGCMDPAALDYDPYAVYQIEECLYPCSDTEQFLIIDINSWQMYGSRKPDCEAYTVTKIYKNGIF